MINFLSLLVYFWSLLLCGTLLINSKCPKPTFKSGFFVFLVVLVLRLLFSADTVPDFADFQSLIASGTPQSHGALDNVYNRFIFSTTF